MSDKALASGFNTNPRILEDVLEALIGACYLDLGLVGARQFVLTFIHTYVDNSMLVHTNYKDTLMQYCQAQGKDTPLPEYNSTKVGDVFHVTATACGKTGRGQARVKKEAQQVAARDCLRVLDALEKNGRGL
jgi:ribonuclease-3